jgi:membrane protease YdiL (CAAX protease family)
VKPWGIFATFGWAVLAMLLGMAVAFVGFYVYFDGIPQAIDATKYDGGAVSIEALLTNTVVVLVLALASRLARWNVIDYLALIWPSRRDLVLGLGVTLLLIIAMDGSSWLIGREFVTQFQLEAYRTARATGWLPFLFVAVVIAAPIGEDIMHRGFLFRGWARSPATTPVAIVVISLLWAALHIQYDWFGITQIVVIGLVLGWLRWRTGSTLLTILCHALINLGATIETVIVSDWLS